MAVSERVQEVAGKLQQLNVEEKKQLFALAPSLWESIPFDKFLAELSRAEETIRHGMEYRLNKEKQQILSQLLEKNRSGTLTSDEEAEMDELIEEAEELTLFKAQALYTLKSKAGGRP
jgi:hypothetical protein